MQQAGCLVDGLDDTDGGGNSIGGFGCRDIQGDASLVTVGGRAHPAGDEAGEVDLGGWAQGIPLDYYESASTWGRPEPDTDVPVAVAVMPYDLGLSVRRIAEQNHSIVRWTEFERGGHFAAMEEPGLIIDDVRAAFRDYRT